MDVRPFPERVCWMVSSAAASACRRRFRLPRSTRRSAVVRRGAAVARAALAAWISFHPCTAARWLARMRPVTVWSTQRVKCVPQ